MQFNLLEHHTEISPKQTDTMKGGHGRWRANPTSLRSINISTNPYTAVGNPTRWLGCLIMDRRS